MLYMVTCTIHIPQMLAYIPYMDPMGNVYGLMNPFLMNLHQTIPIYGLKPP